MRRIESFLNEPEVPDWASTLKASVNPVDQGIIGFVQATFNWENSDSNSSASLFSLGPLNITFPRGQLTLISGATGSGKSAVLAALLGGNIMNPRNRVNLTRGFRNALHIW